MLRSVLPRHLASTGSVKPPPRIAIRGEAGSSQRMKTHKQSLTGMLSSLACRSSKALPRPATWETAFASGRTCVTGLLD